MKLFLCVDPANKVYVSPSRRHGERYVCREQELVAALKQCSKVKDLEAGKKLHSQAVADGRHTNRYVATALIRMYGRCGCIGNARDVFEKMPERDTVAWNWMILGYVENGQSVLALELFNRMDCDPNSVTYVAALKACRGLETRNQSEKLMCFEQVDIIHEQAREHGCVSNMLVASTLLDIYSKLGRVSEARRVFDMMPSRDVVAWTCLILGYAENGDSSAALELFNRMDCQPNYVTFVAVLKACASMSGGYGQEKELWLERGILIHERAKKYELDRNIFVANTLLDMYSKFGNMTLAKNVFDRMSFRNAVSWTTLVLGYVENGDCLAALELFRGIDCELDNVTFIAAIKACGRLARLSAGREIHARVCRLGLEQDELVANSLVDFYGRCGNMAVATQVFNGMQTLDMVSWNSLTAGYSAIGDVPLVFTLVAQMEDTGLQPDGVTFTCIVSACNHAGMVEEGKFYFERMLKAGIRPSAELQTCMRDMLARANRVQEAESVNPWQNFNVARSKPRPFESV